MTRIKSNRFIRQIMSEVRHTDPYEAVHTLVGRHREAGTSLERLAGSLGVRGITVTQMNFDGGVFEDSSGLHVRLNSESSPRRRRFTLAHEIAHLIIDRGSARGARRSHGCTELERECDLVAAELLMPLDELQGKASEAASTGALLAIADCFSVSPQAAAVRLNELGVWSESLGQWIWGNEARELWFVGKRYWPHKVLYLSTFERAAIQGAVIASEIITNQGRRAFPVFLDVRRLGRDKVYLLAVLSRSSKAGFWASAAPRAAPPARSWSATGRAPDA